MTLEKIQGDKEVKIIKEPVISSKKEFEQFFAEEKDCKLVNEPPKFANGWKDLIIRCFNPT